MIQIYLSKPNLFSVLPPEGVLLDNVQVRVVAQDGRERSSTSLLLLKLNNHTTLSEICSPENIGSSNFVQASVISSFVVGKEKPVSILDFLKLLTDNVGKSWSNLAPLHWQLRDSTCKYDSEHIWEKLQ